MVITNVWPVGSPWFTSTINHSLLVRKFKSVFDIQKRLHKGVISCGKQRIGKDLVVPPGFKHSKTKSYNLQNSAIPKIDVIFIGTNPSNNDIAISNLQRLIFPIWFFPVLHFYKKNVISNKVFVAAVGDNIPRNQLFSCAKRHDVLHQSQVSVWRFISEFFSFDQFPSTTRCCGFSFSWICRWRS